VLATRVVPLFLLLAATAARAENAVTAGAVLVERPTLICLGFEWDIQGDDNRNAAAFTGRAPDFGVYELDRPLPIYGPRWVTKPPFYR
jgi:hypothetical protein